MVAPNETVDLALASTLLRVLEGKSLSAAARQLGVPKSTVSRRLSTLEAQLGVQLLRRSPRSVVATDAGIAFADRAREALQTLDAAVAAARDSEGPPRGTVRITAAVDVGQELLAEPLAALTAEYPEIVIELGLFSRRVDLVAERWDLAIRAGDPGAGSLIAKKLASLGWGVYAAASYLETAAPIEAPSDLTGHRMVVFAPAIQLGMPTLEGPLGRFPIAPAGNLRADDLSFCLRAAESGAGIAMLPIKLAQRAEARGALVRVLPEYAAPGAHLNLVYVKDRYLSRAVAVVRDRLVAVLSDSAPKKAKAKL